MSKELDIFNLSVEDLKVEETTTSTKTDFYKTDPKKGKDSVYRSIIRFIPNINNPKKSIIKKYTYWLENNSGEGFYVDCPSSINEKSIIQDTFWKLYKSDSAFDKKQAERIKRKEYYYSYVLIQKDAQNPELEGTVQIFRYPRAIKKLIDAQLQPEAEDLEMGATPVNVFDLFAGKDFFLKVVLKGGFWNYDECKFASNQDAISIKGVKMENTSESRKQILSIYEGLNDIADNEFKPWTDDIRNKVNDFLVELTGTPSSAISNVSSQPKPAVSRQQAETKPKASTPVEISTYEELPEITTAQDEDEEVKKWLAEFGVN
jgi:hypothetical protein